ncbi:fused response regulator/phosphatase [Fundidesulfovibrio butyratiphilus]
MDEAPLILVVDDEQINRSLLRWSLIDAGFRVLLASNGPEARLLALAENPDCIILDILMPEESGFETCAKLLGNPATRDIPIIFLSGMDAVDDKVRGLKIGAVDYVTKPFSGEEVVARVKIHLRLRQANRALIAEQAAKLSQIRDAQQAILVSPGEMPAAKFAVRYRPALEAGGDFYDVFPLGPSRYGYFVADVAGHDLGASFITSSLKALIRQNSGPLYGPDDTLRTMNGVLLSVLAPGKHLTAAYLTVARPSGRCRLVNAGHPCPILVRSTGEAEVVSGAGDVLGAFESVHLEIMSVAAKPGDRFFLCTDGLLDLAGRNQEKALARLAEVCAKTCGASLEEAADQVVNALLPGQAPSVDDIVLMAVEV